ncbi:MAG: orotidine-5'-phosphate decarboxylase [Patescibacteria group bacterium]
MMDISGQPWLTKWEQISVIEELLHYGLIKSDNARSLPLKSGGKTDIYINLRDARNYPKALDFLAETYANALRRLGPDRFAEVPDAVSCFAGLISVKTGIPYVTLREKPKEGRVAKADVIGEARFDESVCIIDDVITDGASKLAPYLKCVSMGLQVLPHIVLVDRQQGWKKKFQEMGIKVGIWPGLTLHDIRKYLITSGLMLRCDAEVEQKNPLIVALDGKSWEEILPVIDQLRTSGCILKANDLLLNEGIKDLIPNLQVYGRVMADLKCHDIKNTVENIIKHLLPNPPWAATIHASGGEEMAKAAVELLKDTPTKVLAVTVLTSLKEGTCEEIYTRRPMEEVLKLAEIANRAGVHGFVCSAEEVSELKRLYPDKELATPGIRSPGVDPNDQGRVDTPVNARNNGASKLVMGRQIFGAADPVAEVKRLLKEELNIN